MLASPTNASGDPITVTQFLVNGQTYAAGDTADVIDTSRPAKWQAVGKLTIDADGTMTFVPSANWNGTMPRVSYLWTDGTDTGIQNVNIDVTPVNDAPYSTHTLIRASSGFQYTFKPSDFPVKDWDDSDHVNLADVPSVAASSVTITSLPPPGGTLLLDGVPVTIGQVISPNDLIAGKLVIQVDNSYKGGGMMPFKFRVQDDGGTDNGGQDTSGEYMFRLNVSQILSGDNYASTYSKPMFGGSGRDIIVGDAGGVTVRQTDPNADLNIALLIDRNAFDDQRMGNSSAFPTKEEALKNSLTALLNGELLNHAGKVNVSLILFDQAGSAVQISIEDLTASNIQNILDEIDLITTGARNSSADYTFAFNEAKTWFDHMAGNGYGNYENKTFFITASKPTGDWGDKINAFNDLKSVSEVHAIDMQHGDFGKQPSDELRIDQYDTTNTQSVADVNHYTVHADFQNNTGANDLSAWEKTGAGAWGIASVNGSSRFGFRSGDVNVDYRGVETKTVVTQTEAHKMVVSDPNGAHFSFTVWQDQARFFDMYSWRLLKWDASADGGNGAWVMVEQGGDSLGALLSSFNTPATITTGNHPPGEYRFQFEVAGLGFYQTPGTLWLDDIRIHKPVDVGTAQYVKTAEQLDDVLTINGSFKNTVSNDTINPTTVGPSILFGDAIYTDGLPWGSLGADGNPIVQPPGRHGTFALMFFLEAKFGYTPTHEEIFQFIWDNHRLFNSSADTHGGNDTFQPGQFDTLVFGGGGDDVILNSIGSGGTKIFYGGAGNDQINGASSSTNYFIGGSGNDNMYASNYQSYNHFVWLDGDAGTVGVPAIDSVGFFSLDRSVGWEGNYGRDTIDLRDLLIGEENGDLSDYLNIAFVGGRTEIKVSSTGNLNVDGSGFDQQINISGIDLRGGYTVQQDIIDHLINSGTLLVGQ